MIPIYYGFEPRQEYGSHVFCGSLIRRSSWPVSLSPLHLAMFKSFYAAGQRDGSNAFVYTRFLIPFLQDFKGWAIFADGSDMVCMADIAELWALRDEYKAVQVVKHRYVTRHAKKYRGTAMETGNADYQGKNWSSLMLVNCASYGWRGITPEAVQKMSGTELHSFSFLPQDRVGDLPAEWNWLADEYGDNPDAKIVHWTAGIPGLPEYQETPMAHIWHSEARRASHLLR